MGGQRKLRKYEALMQRCRRGEGKITQEIEVWHLDLFHKQTNRTFMRLVVLEAIRTLVDGKLVATVAAHYQWRWEWEHLGMLTVETSDRVFTTEENARENLCAHLELAGWVELAEELRQGVQHCLDRG